MSPVAQAAEAEAAPAAAIPGETPEGVQAKKEVHAAWASQLPLGTHRVTENAGSYVHHEEPELVLQAVQHILEAVRDR